MLNQIAQAGGMYADIFAEKTETIPLIVTPPCPSAPNKGNVLSIAMIPVRLALLAFCINGSIAIDSFASDSDVRPNIIHIMADDLGWGDIGCYGNPFILTPNLDQMASNGIRYTQAYANSGVCSPSRAGIMTGNFPAVHRIHCWYNLVERNVKHGMPQYLDPSVVTVTSLMKQSGYTTAHFGKWHMCSADDPNVPSPAAYGIDQWKVYIGATDKAEEGDPQWNWNVPDFHSTSTAAIIDESITFLNEKKDKPFYMNIWLHQVHRILDPTDEMMKPYEKYGMKKRNDLKRTYHGIRKIYYASVTEMDKQLGRLLDYLDEQGLTENTLVVFTSDNGPENNMLPDASYAFISHTAALRGLKGSNYEGGVKVPFIAQWKGHIPANHINRETVISGVDWLPTVAALAGIELPADYTSDGQDVSTSLGGDAMEREKPLFWEWRFGFCSGTYPLHISPALAMRDGQWKFLMNHDGSRKELYDLSISTMEVDNLADRNPDLVEKFSTQLMQWQRSLPTGPIYPRAGDNSYDFN